MGMGEPEASPTLVMRGSHADREMLLHALLSCHAMLRVLSQKLLLLLDNPAHGATGVKPTSTIRPLSLQDCGVELSLFFISHPYPQVFHYNIRT